MKMARYAKIEAHIGLVRDLETQAVLNTDLAALRRHEQHVIELTKAKTRRE